jgi:hypothetical protein
MAFIDQERTYSDKEFYKLANAAGYKSWGDVYSTPEQIASWENWNRIADIASNVERKERPEGISRDAVISIMNAQWARDQPTQQMNYAINRQKSMAGLGNQQQMLSMEQRNVATAEALANAKATPGPGRSAYDQRLQQMMLGSFTPDDPSYQWRMEQGMNNLARSSAAKGMLGSGNMAAELLSFGQGMASQEYGSQFNRLLQASANATSQYTAAYSVLDRMLQQQQAQQNLGYQGEQVAQEWGRLAQGWNNQNMGYMAQDTSRFSAAANAQAQAGQLSVQREQNALRRDQFNAEQQRLDNWNQGQGAALMQGAGEGQAQAGQPNSYTQQTSYNTGGYGPIQNSTASQLPSGTGYVQNNNTGATTSFGGGGGGGGQGYQSWGNDYGYEAVYGD